jgi:hypothetical protein
MGGITSRQKDEQNQVLQKGWWGWLGARRVWDSGGILIGLEFPTVF